MQSEMKEATEIWKDIPGYEKLYQGSNLGRIRSLDRWKDSGTGGYIQKGRILKPFKTKYGYLQVVLCKDGKQKALLVHRLVYEAFNGEIPEGVEVNHISEDKTDSSLGNLNLLTHKANINWGTHNKRISEKLTNGKLSKCVYQYTLDGVLVKIWSSTNECGRNSFNQGAVCACCRGKLKQYKGFLWSYTKL